MVLAVSACSGSPTTPTPSESLDVKLEVPGFQIYGGRTPAPVLREVAARLAATRPRMAADLGVDEERLGTITVRVWQDEATWVATLEAYFGERLAATGYVTGPTELRLLAVETVGVNATHELAHAVSLHVNPVFANNPRWWWEAVALYENGELVDPRTLPYMRQGQPPTLAALNAPITAGRQIYDVGFLLGEFVVVQAGRDGLRQLIRANGDTVAVLGMTASQFEQAWYTFVRARYGL